jgi:hypothetical protein
MDDDRHLLLLQDDNQSQAFAVLECVVEHRDIGPVGRNPFQRIGAAGKRSCNRDADPLRQVSTSMAISISSSQTRQTGRRMGAAFVAKRDESVCASAASIDSLTSGSV